MMKTLVIIRNIRLMDTSGNILLYLLVVNIHMSVRSTTVITLKYDVFTDSSDVKVIDTESNSTVASDRDFVLLTDAEKTKAL